ncbi:6887_t:CDS:2 [Acaulospora morrowiae]|uniref:6887_t:CDS:1 n=1 Tax=Acaulospora morrowiae TaxID=94023 RepID=A0A9N9BA38_9GLOM|nr:6887_t:CDS:2 [Acaulospora morrowiae]
MSSFNSLHSRGSYKSKLFDISGVVKPVKMFRAESISDSRLIDLEIPDIIDSEI